MEPIQDNPWKNTSPEDLDPNEKEIVEDNLEDLFEELNKISEDIEKISNMSGARNLVNLKELNEYEDNLCLLDNPVLVDIIFLPPTKIKYYNLESNPSIVDINEIKVLVDEVKKYQIKAHNNTIDPSIFHIDLETKKEKVESLNSNINSLNIDSNNILSIDDFNKDINDFKKLKESIDSSRIKNALKDKDLNEKFKIFKLKNKSFISRIFNRDYKNIKNEFENYYNTKVSSDQIILDFSALIQLNENMSFLREKFLDYYEDKPTDEKIIIESEKLLKWEEELENIKKELNNFLLDSEKTLFFDDLEEGLNEIIQAKKLLEIIESKDDMGTIFFPDLWKAENTNVLKLEKLYNNLLDFNKLYNSEFFSDETFELLKNTIDMDELCRLIERLKTHKDIILKKHSILNDLLKFKNNELFDILSTDIYDLREVISSLKNNFNLFNEYRLFKYYCKKYDGGLLKNLIPCLFEDKIKKDAIKPIFNFNLSNNLLKNVFQDNKTLYNFNSKQHGKNVEKFRELDKKIIKLNRIRVQDRINRNIPNMDSVHPRSELGILQIESVKKSRIKPIRKILRECINAIKMIKPCFMMSPIAVTQFLDNNYYANHFDYVIFDEASQVKVEDAMGSMLRGKNYIIIGDTKQLPPTTFFEKEVTNDEEEGEEDTYNYMKDVESILNIANMVFPKKMLKWHYRSRHDSLIAVSNEEFYNNELYIFPSPSKESEELGLKLEYCPETVYDRGKSSRNIKLKKL